MELLWTAAAALLIALSAGLQPQIKVKSNFSCEGRPSGYYADVEVGCQIYHMCDGLGRQFSYSCPNTTLFQQRMLICDHWYMVNCSKSEEDYNANLLIGQAKKPFVEDSVKHPYHRTPRPDLLQHPKEQEYEIVYRTGRAQYGTNLNLVGADLDHIGESTGTDKPAYSLPSRWSTEFSKSATDNPVHESTQNIPVKTKYKPQENVNKKVKVHQRNKSINGPSTTQSPILTRTEVPINFKSNFQATTPKFPTSVDVTPPSIADDQLPPLLDPLDTLNINPAFLTDLEKAKKSKTSVLDLVSPPSAYYEPPKYDTSKPINVKSPPKKVPSKLPVGEKQWIDLRKHFLIPDYEFPLDTAARPGYGDGPNSFQVSPFFDNTRQN